MSGIDYKEAKSIYYFTVNDLDGEPVCLEKYEGNVCIIVNIASECGLTKTNFEELKQLHKNYAESKGLRILAFPCNQFARTEPGDSSSIKQYVKMHNLPFDVFEKIHVNGSDGSPLWKYLKLHQEGIFGNFIKWNFTKFIIDRKGKPVERFGPNTSPNELIDTLKKYW
ncbi:phospholipid hydroperoxide glutathione peroxidase-like [Harmonia axyridis]|uniref:phospholipid hydroperoxide glutathione peroxidase-like n=1 Tax=Harmonia axyridis TaxID=115357 RepID=UPI001E276785|nr:phospholipid hydroperoxide glutathione peroxidase-like [Harmonia axyridis]